MLFVTVNLNLLLMRNIGSAMCCGLILNLIIWNRQFLIIKSETGDLAVYEKLFNKIVTITGGRSAEEIVFGSITSGAANDIEQATRIARAMVTRLGMTEEFDMMATEVINNVYLGGDASLQCSAETAGKIDAKVLEIIKEAHAKAKAILSENRDKLDELAQFLLDKETITGEEFMAVLNGDEQELKIVEEEQA